MEPATDHGETPGAEPLDGGARVAGIDLIVADVARSTRFYRGLGFTAAGDGEPAKQELTFGRFTLGLTAAAPDARPYPSPRAANDPWFQHFCIAVADMPRAFAALSGLGATPISQGGPQLLPPNTGSVIAYKFRDPDGHPLELSYIPGSDWLRDAPVGAIFLGVDHTAIAVATLDRSIAYYATFGFAVSGRSLNAGIEQDRLDGLDGIAVDIVALSLTGGPHLELLRYRAPVPQPALAVNAGDIAATRTVVAGAGDLNTTRLDPDGHILVLSLPNRSPASRLS